jgi:hypothetical protein
MREEAFIRAGLEVRFTVIEDAQRIVPAVIEAVREIEAISAAGVAVAKL